MPPAALIFSSMIAPTTVAGTVAIPAALRFSAMAVAKNARTGSGSARSLGRRTGPSATVFSAGKNDSRGTLNGLGFWAELQAQAMTASAPRVNRVPVIVAPGASERTVVLEVQGRVKSAR